MKHHALFSEEHTLKELKHFLPTQAPLKDFIHHNTLHAFQHETFHRALHEAREIFGYNTYLTLPEFREMYRQGRIKPEVLDRVIAERKGEAEAEEWKDKMLNGDFQLEVKARIGSLREQFKQRYKINLDKSVHPTLFRLLGNFLDQGISVRPFPSPHKGFLASIREMERSSAANLFRRGCAKELLLHTHCKPADLLDILIGDERLYEQYLFDQQFSHPGWSGMVAYIESDPGTLLDRRHISLRELIILELLMEIDAMDARFGTGNWEPLSRRLPENERPLPLFAPVEECSLAEVTALWQEAFEWTYYHQVLAALEPRSMNKQRAHSSSFDAFFCIDDRECSFRRHIEQVVPACRTWGTPGFFNVEFYFQPEHGKFLTKVCPAPVTPKYLIREVHARGKHSNDAHFTKRSHGLLFGWLISQTLGFWAAFRLFLNIFKPSVGPATSYSFNHMDKHARLTIENTDPEDRVHGLQIGFTVQEMADRVEGLLRSTGLTGGFSPLVYMVGHGASSINNTHYAGYDCGACSGRPGSVNARVISFMANHPCVREILKNRGIDIPSETQFVGALHDTTRDEIEFYDEDAISTENTDLHRKNVEYFNAALDLNAKERSRRFVLMNHNKPAARIHQEIKLRSVSLFEPRPELNHATNALCIIGRRTLTDRVFLDRRAFMNSYDYKKDPDGKYLLNILKAAAPVCGGINLEYYFSRVDNYRLGAGTKLPHNVIGLIGVANGADGDLRPGLPNQMVEVHDPLRLLMVVEQFPEVVLNTLSQSPETAEWFRNSWIHLIAIDPETGIRYRFRKDAFEKLDVLNLPLPEVFDAMELVEKSSDNLPVIKIGRAV